MRSSFGSGPNKSIIRRRQVLSSINNWWWGGSGGGGGGSFSVSKLSVKYNNTDHSYLTTSADWTDTGSLFSNVISITTVATDTDGGVGLNSNTGLLINEGIGSIADDEIGVKTGFPSQIIFFKRSDIPLGGSTSIPSSSRTLVSGGVGQGIAFDPVNQYILEEAGATIKIRDLSNNTIQIFNRPETGSGFQYYYDYTTGDLYASRDTNQPILRWRRNATEWEQLEQYWFTGSEGVSLDKILEKVVTQQASFQTEQDLTGFKTKLSQAPITNGEAEGFVIDPRDGTYWKNSDDYFHGTIVNGNRLIHFDPRGWYNKWLRFPNMIRYDAFKLTSSLNGYFGDQTLTGNDWNISPVIDFDAFTEQQNINNWFGDDVDFEFRGSSSAPDTSPEDCFNLSFYDANNSNDGWGTTVPGAWQSTPTTDRYMQFRVKAVTPTPVVPMWTPDDITTSVWSESIGFDNQFSEKYFDMYVDVSSSPAANQFRVTTLINKGNTANNFNVGTANSRPLYDTTLDYLLFTSTATRHYILDDPAPILAITECDVHVYARRTLATNTAIFFTAHNTANSNDRIVLVWLPLTHATFPNGIAIIHNDGAATVSMYGVALASTDFKLITYRLGGVANKIFIDGVEQALTVISGSNTGQCFDNLTTANTVRIGRIQGGTATPLTVRDSNHDQKFLMVNNPSDTDFSDIIAYLTEEGII